MRRYLVIANAHAGRVEREALDAAVGVLSAAGPTEVHMSTDAAALDAALTGLDGRIPVVAGGDGSLHLVVNRLRRAGRLDQVTLGLVPLGTGNDFARAARVPLDPLVAAVALTTARPAASTCWKTTPAGWSSTPRTRGSAPRRPLPRPTTNRVSVPWRTRWGRCSPGSGRRAGCCGSAWMGPLRHR